MKINSSTVPVYDVSRKPRGRQSLTDSQKEKVNEAIEILFSVLSSANIEDESLTSPDLVKTFLKLNILDEKEHFSVMFLDNQHRLLSHDIMFHGTIDGAAVYPREIVKSALYYNAAAVVLAHNHPSGIAEPSAADRDITEQIKKTLELIDVRVLDHIIVCNSYCESFAERGIL